MEVFMDDFSVYGSSFKNCLDNLYKVLARCEEKILVLNWEKCHFMVNDRIVLGHKVSAADIEVDRAKIEVMTGLPAPTNVKDVRSFLGHDGFYRRFINFFSKIARPLTFLLCKEVKFDFSPECVKSFEEIKKTLIMILKSNRKIQIILQHMFANPKPKTFMTYNIYLLIYVENNSVLVNLNLNY